MSATRLGVVALAVGLTVMVQPTRAEPGFDCAKATRQIDKSICAWDTVGSLDGAMAAAFKAAIEAQADEAGKASVKAGQKTWLAERDRRCALDAVVPDSTSEDDLSPREMGQLLCLQAVYPPRVAQLVDLAAPPLVPTAVKMMPEAALSAAYPDRWRQLSYQAQYSPDGTALLLEISGVVSSYTNQLWLYWPQDGHLVAASPLTHRGEAEGPEDVSELNGWFWDDVDGLLYVQARRPLGKDGIFAAGRDGYSELTGMPAKIVERFEARDEAAREVRETADPYAEERRNEQEDVAYAAWAVNTGHGFLDLRVTKDGGEPQTVASGGWEIEDFVLDAKGGRVFYNGENGLLVTDLGGNATRRLKGTYGRSLQTKPLAIAPDGSAFVYISSGSCTRDAADGTILDDEAENTLRICLVQLPVVEAGVEALAKASSDAAGDPWVGKWSGSGIGALSATIRRGTAKPEFAVVDIVTGAEGCSGAITAYGKPGGKKLVAESYDATNPTAPVCKIEISLGVDGAMTAEEYGECGFYHGQACSFEGTLARKP